MELKTLKLSEITFGDRFRQDYGDLEELAASIKEKELINPITVTLRDGQYILAAGGRRYLACKLLNMEEIPCRIYEKELSELELRAIELEENIKRKGMSFIEECNIKAEMLRVQQEIHGVKKSTAADAAGVSLRDVAQNIGISHAQFSRDVELAKSMEAFPELPWDKCKTKHEALKMVNKLEETMLRKELAKRVEETLGNKKENVFLQKLLDCYIVGDFFTHVKDLPSNYFNLVEIDPPYAIDLKTNKREYAYDAEKYNEVPFEKYPSFMTELFKECYRVMSENSYLICWFGPEPWFAMIHKWLTDAGFKTTRNVGIWSKPNGQCNHPSMYLANSYEMFFYAWKGSPVIAKQGRNNNFVYGQNSANKVHPTERPIEMIADVITTFGMEGSKVLVPFAGSGNTLIAAAMNSMIPLGYDLTGAYRNSYVIKTEQIFGGQNEC